MTNTPTWTDEDRCALEHDLEALIQNLFESVMIDGCGADIEDYFDHEVWPADAVEQAFALYGMWSVRLVIDKGDGSSTVT